MTRTPFITEIIRHLVDFGTTEANAGTMALAYADLIESEEKAGASAKFAATRVLMLVEVAKAPMSHSDSVTSIVDEWLTSVVASYRARLVRQHRVRHYEPHGMTVAAVFPSLPGHMSHNDFLEELEGRKSQPAETS